MGWKELPTSQDKLGKGNVGRDSMEEVMGAARTHGERVRKTATGSRGARLGYGEGSSLHPAQKKNSETPPKPTLDTLNTTSTSQWEMGRQPRPQCFLFKTSKNISTL